MPEQDEKIEDQICRCKHPHSCHQELLARNPNITAGQCLMVGCDCKYFCMPSTRTKEDNRLLFDNIERQN